MIGILSDKVFRTAWRGGRFSSGSAGSSIIKPSQAGEQGRRELDAGGREISGFEPSRGSIRAAFCAAWHGGRLALQAVMLCCQQSQLQATLFMNTPTPAPSPAQAARALLKQLQADFPVFRQAKPLSIGIDKQLLARLPDINRKILRIALGMHTNSLRYLKAMEKAAERYNLEGNVDGAVSETHRSHAVQTLRERQKKEAEQRRAEHAAQQAEQARRQSEEKLHQLAEKFSRGR
jgi:ProP effector